VASAPSTSAPHTSPPRPSCVRCRLNQYFQCRYLLYSHQ
ncbi:hypothetical protein BBOMB_1570, partial [Bifidobacterium bombi DSM 19703]